MEAYFDNSATTRPCPAAVEAVRRAMTENWGNPSSLHEMGIRAEAVLDGAAKRTASLLHCKKEEIVFTSGGTQGNNIAVLGAAKANAARRKKLITDSIEHPSVDACFERMKNEGFDVVKIKNGRFGDIDLEQLESELGDDVSLVSVMAVNNELGTVNDLKKIASLIRTRAKNALFHVDAVQAFCKTPLDVRAGIDLMTVSSHKIHGTKGAGALYVRKGVRLLSPVMGGEQGRGIRTGTEPVPAIAGFCAAMDEADIARDGEKVKELSLFLRRGLSELPFVTFNSPDGASPYIINAAFNGYPGEVILNFFSDRGIYVSTGSACAKGASSPVLAACGIDKAAAGSSIRISLSKYNTREEAEYLLSAARAIPDIIRHR